MSAPAPPRVRWREGQTLRAADLAAEQAYRLDAARRHRLGLHAPGVVSGLSLSPGPGAGVTVAAGAAVDGLGRSLLLGRPQVLGVALLDAAAQRLGREELVVSLRRGSTAAGGAPASGTSGADPCAGGGDRARRADADCLQLTAAGIAPPPPVRPSAAGEDDAPAVPLGRLVREDGAWRVEEGGRSRAGLVAQRVEDPAGRARLELEDAAAGGRLTVSVGDGSAAPVERLAVAPDGSSTLTGSTAVAGAVRLEPAGARRSQHVRFGALAAPPEEARPWSLYRADVQPLDAAGAPAGPLRRQLRMEIAAPGRNDDPAGLLLAVGRRDGDGGFDRCLSVDGHRRLRVRRLVVEGQVAESPVPADPSDPRFAAAAAGAWLEGIGSALGQFAAVTVEVDVAVAGLVAGEALRFTITVRNVGPTPLQDVRVSSQLVGRDDSRGPQLHRVVPLLAAGGEERVAASYPALAIVGLYTLTGTAVATGPGSTPVTASHLVPIEVLATIG